MAAEPEGMDLRLLGPVRARLGGAERALGSPRRTAVLSVLALHAGHAVSRGQLISAVWGDDPPASATGNVYTYVSSLRRLLEPDRDRWTAGALLTSDGGGYRLHLPAAAVDVHRFTALREQSRQHRTGGDHPAELAALAAALRLWRGEALAGVPGPYAQAQRLRLAELRLSTVERHAAVLAELGRPDEAAVALRAYDRLRAALRGRTGAEPGGPPRGIARGTAGRRPAANPNFVGRTAELRRLRAAAAAVAAGRGGSIWITGAPGMGKSALLAAALRETPPPGCRVGWGAGDELAHRMPLGVLLECLESATPPDASREFVERLAAVTAGTAGATAARTTARAVAVIRRAAAREPLILIVDDLELTDDATVRVWTALHPLTGDLPLLLVSGGGPAGDDRRLDPLRAAHPAELRLTGLTTSDATALVHRVAPEPPPQPILRRLLADAGGNPYYLRQLAAATHAGTEPGDPLPAAVLAAVGAHLDRFPHQTRQLLRAVAFLSAGPTGSGGDTGCTVAEVSAVTGRSEDDIRRLLAPAHAVQVLVTGARLAFRHPIVARALYEGTPTALRVMLRRWFAERLAEGRGRIGAPVPDAGVPRDGYLTW